MSDQINENQVQEEGQEVEQTPETSTENAAPEMPKGGPQGHGGPGMPPPPGGPHGHGGPGMPPPPMGGQGMPPQGGEQQAAPEEQQEAPEEQQSAETAEGQQA